MKLEFSEQIFQKMLKCQFHDSLFSEIWVVPCGRTNRHDEANSHFSPFCGHT